MSMRTCRHSVTARRRCRRLLSLAHLWTQPPDAGAPRRVTHIGWVQAQLKRLILQQAAVSVHCAIAWVLLAQQLLVSVVAQGLQLTTATGVCHAVEPVHFLLLPQRRGQHCLLLCCLCY